MEQQELNEGQEILFNHSQSSQPTEDVLDQVMAQAQAQPTLLQPEPIATVTISQNKLVVIKHLADNLQATAKQLSDILATYVADQEIKPKSLSSETVRQPVITPATVTLPAEVAETGRVIEGIFNGEKMIGPDGQLYDVPVNYASKSKLVEGDMLKLIITERGTFVYKQIQPVERVRLVGLLEQGPTGE